MIIDGNEREKAAFAAIMGGDDKRGHQLEDQFLSDVLSSGEDHCSCTVDCPRHGNCVACVVLHRAHQDHLPNCFHMMVNQRVEAFLGLTERTLKRP